MEQTQIPVFATFYIRDGKAARDKGDMAEMNRQIAKVTVDHRLSAEQKAICLDKIRHAAYHPNPTKPVSGCVTPGYSRVYTAKVTPLDQALNLIHEALKAGDLTPEQAQPRLAKIEAALEAEETAKVDARRKAALDQIDALLA